MRPDFKNIKSYQEFKKYYWYREELKEICKKLELDFSGTKIELNKTIEEYFKGNIIKPRKKTKLKKITNELTLDTKLLECGFSFNQKFRDFFKEKTRINNFKFNADMVVTAKKVKEKNDTSFTLGNMLEIYYGQREYAKYDKSSCEWNKFLKDFCKDKNSLLYSNKLKVAAILWNEVRNSTKEKIYRKELLNEYFDKIEKYIIK